VKLLFDQNISFKIVRLIGETFPESKQKSFKEKQIKNNFATLCTSAVKKSNRKDAKELRREKFKNIFATLCDSAVKI
jgi:hypothetical protein